LYKAAFCIVTVLAGAGAQVPAQQPAAAGILTPEFSDQIRADYILSAGDQILVRTLEMEELNERSFVIDGDGNIALPLIGIVRIGGLNVEAARDLLLERMRKFVRDPQVTLTVMRFRAEPVFLTGPFRQPGTYPLQGRRTLGDLLISAGGLAPGAVRRIRLTRRAEHGLIPLPGAQTSADGKLSEVLITTSPTGQLNDLSEDIPLKPFDVLTAEKAEMIYLTGELGKVGAIDVGDKEALSVLQVVAMSGGLTRDANGSEARILRPVLNTTRRAEIPVDVKAIMQGKAKDFMLMPNDVLFIPAKAGTKRNFARILGYTAPPLVTTLIWTLAR
jgi:polysaccharide export outer membrane protein